MINLEVASINFLNEEARLTNSLSFYINDLFNNLVLVLKISIMLIYLGFN